VTDDVLRVINEKVSEELSRVYKRNMSRYLSLAVAFTTNFNGQITGCVNDDWPCQWERAIFDPPHTEFTPLNRSQKFGTGDYVGGPYGCAKFGANMPTGALGKWVKYITIFIYLFIFFLSEN